MRKYPVFAVDVAIKVIAVFTLLGGLSVNAQAGSFGLGVSVKSGDTTVFLPYKLANLLLEPYLRYRSVTDDDQYSERDLEYWSAGIGLFDYRKTAETIHLYYGIRVSYAERNIDYYYPPPPSSSSPANYYDESLEGYELSPTAGFSYRILPDFYLDGELEWFYQNLDGKIDDDGELIDGKYKTHGTNTRVIFRYYFE